MKNDHLKPDEIGGFDALTGDRRMAALEHLSGCSTCRVACLADNQASVFALLARVTVPEEKLEQLSARIEAALDGVAPGVQVRRSPFHRIASIAASLLLAVVLGAVMWNHEAPQPVASFAEIEALGVDEDVPGIRLVATPGEQPQVLDLSIGGTQILMIFDESIEL